MSAKIHPSQTGRREILRQHRWKFGHDPADDDAVSGSPWRYLKLEYFDPSDPDQRDLLTGGPDTGHTCWECKNDTYHVAGARPADWVLTQPGVEIVGGTPDLEKVKDIDIVVWGCPTCGHKVQWRSDEMPAFKETK